MYKLIFDGDLIDKFRRSMSDEEMKRILLYCQILGFEGLRNGTYAIIPQLKLTSLNQIHL